MSGPLVIGVGTLDAGDDAAGRLVARALAGRGLRVTESAGVAADILMRMEGASHVIIIDASRSGAPPGTLRRFDADREPIPADLSPTSSHGMGVAEALGLARALGQMPDRVTVWAIEGADFSLGAGVHPAVQAAVADCAERILQSLAPTAG